jgi:hypothetical protein
MKVTLDTPCTIDWQSMTGDNKRRFCGLCKKNVHNLSGLTQKEAHAFLKDKDTLCVRYVPQTNGNVRFQPAPIRTWIFVAIALSAAACDTTEPLSSDTTSTEPKETQQEIMEHWVSPEAECDTTTHLDTQAAPSPQMDSPRKTKTVLKKKQAPRKARAISELAGQDFAFDVGHQIGVSGRPTNLTGIMTISAPSPKKPHIDTRTKPIVLPENQEKGPEKAEKEPKKIEKEPKK